MNAGLIDRAEALKTVERYLFDGVEKPLAAMAQAHSTCADGQSFSVMSRSGNAMSVLERFLEMALRRGLITEKEAVNYVMSVTGGGQL